MLLALEALTKARMSGAKPASVMVTLGNFPQSPWWRDGTEVEIVIADEINVARLDFRSLVGCDVTVIACKRDARLRQAVERIVAHAASVVVLSSPDADDLGHVWRRGEGWRAIGERRAA